MIDFQSCHHCIQLASQPPPAVSLPENTTAGENVLGVCETENQNITISSLCLAALNAFSQYSMLVQIKNQNQKWIGIGMYILRFRSGLIN